MLTFLSRWLKQRRASRENEQILSIHHRDQAVASINEMISNLQREIHECHDREQRVGSSSKELAIARADRELTAARIAELRDELDRLENMCGRTSQI